ncbi:MAG TPA: tripartite tricarboxylate transporter substrate binding protein [Noviherbaspirillum sp.]|jgi:tripartite-type tricarboxylate transporter receptor subunit TctC|uniref:Bug family tripartite tricarboxylate transporter substrate binding protein n=1 Tax=Noviherbaspirillum sp. TaxID=1926288 RepID=UPI002F95DFEF
MLRRLLFSCAMLVFACAAQAAPASDWPSRPLRLVVAAPAGSSLDLIARLIGEHLKDRLGQPIVIDNVPGAAGTIASAQVIRAPADGHTLLMSFNGPLAYARFLTTLPYDPQQNLAPVIQTSEQPNLLVVNTALPVHSVADLIRYARERPGRLNYASVGNGSSSHLTMELFKQTSGVHMVHIPYNGAPPAALATAGGETDVLFSVPSAVMPQIRAGKLRALAVTSARRFPLLPDQPTLAESGLPGFASLTWNGILVPRGTPDRIVTRLNQEIDAILRLPEVRERMQAAGLAPVGGTPSAFTALIDAETRKWGPVIKQTGIKLD